MGRGARRRAQPTPSGKSPWREPRSGIRLLGYATRWRRSTQAGTAHSGPASRRWPASSTGGFSTAPYARTRAWPWLGRETKTCIRSPPKKALNTLINREWKTAFTITTDRCRRRTEDQQNASQDRQTIEKLSHGVSPIPGQVTEIHSRFCVILSQPQDLRK